MKKKNKILRYLSNTRTIFHSFFIWFAPFFLFLLTIFVVTSLLGESLDKYSEILAMFIWPFTVLVILFFFRKILTYFIFATEKRWNIFGAGEELDSIPYLIHKKAEELYAMKVLEKEINENEVRIEKKIDELYEKEEVSSEEWAHTAKEIFDYSKTLSVRYRAAMKEKQKMEEQSVALYEQMESLKSKTGLQRK